MKLALLVRTLVFATACLLSTSEGALAADANGAFAVHGIGGVSCKSVVNDPRYVSDQLLRSRVTEWIAGYVAALNANTPNTFEISPIAQDSEIFGLVTAQCATNPNLLLQQAMQAVLNTLSIIRLTSQSPLVEMKNEFGSVVIRESYITMIQTYLKQSKLFEGYVDGKPTPALIDAIRKFQAAKALSKTGLPDRDTIIKILVEPSLRRTGNTRR